MLSRKVFSVTKPKSKMNKKKLKIKRKHLLLIMKIYYSTIVKCPLQEIQDGTP